MKTISDSLTSIRLKLFPWEHRQRKTIPVILVIKRPKVFVCNSLTSPADGRDALVIHVQTGAGTGDNPSNWTEEGPEQVEITDYH